MDDAIRRRFNLVPFDVKIAPEERDPDLPEKLRAEWAGILQWAVDGCMLWRERGLAAPAVVRHATDEYLEAEDALALWLTECCKIDRSLHSSASTLFASWKSWAEAASEFVGSQKRFSQALQGRGLEPKRDNKGRSGFSGIGLNSPPDAHRDR